MGSERLPDFEIDVLERRLSSDNAVAAEELAAEARRARAAEELTESIACGFAFDVGRTMRLQDPHEDREDLLRQNAALRDALEHIRENTPSQFKLEYDDGNVSLGDFINATLSKDSQPL